MKTTIGRWLLLGALVLSGEVVSAQVAAEPSAEISGRVLNAANDAPLSGAAVLLRLVPDGVFGAREGSSVFRASSLVVMSNENGSYQFGDLASGRYRITVELLGYHPAAVEVELHGRASSRVTLGLQVDPIALEPLGVPISELTPMTVEVAPSQTLEADADRDSNIRDRQARLLEGDARSLGYGELMESVTTGEVDIFRALQRLPGVTTRDEWTAELWTRGGSWGQTRTYFDGQPLLNPLQGGGFASGVIPESVGSVFFLPGGRSVRRGQGAAGIVDMVSRSAREGVAMPVRSELSLVSGRITAEKRFFGGKGGLLVAGRRSWWDLATQGVSEPADRPTDVVNYHIAGVSGNADYALGENTRIVSSWLWERDYLKGNIPGAIHKTRGNWGNTVDQITLETRLWGADFDLTIGESDYNATAFGDESLPGETLDPDVTALDPMSVGLSHRSVRAEFSKAMDGAIGSRWLAGVEFIGESLNQSGAALPINADLLGNTLKHAETDRTAIFAEVRVAATENLWVRAGLRMEAGDSVARSGPTRWSPSVTARYTMSPTLTGSVSFTRSYQYTQALANAGTPFGPQLHIGQSWVLAGANAPAAESDIVTGGLEWWLGDGWLAAGTAWYRRIDDMVVPDPRPGYLHPTSIDPENPAAPFVVGTSQASGIELGIRKVAGRTTGSLSYSFTETDTQAAGLTFRSPTERPHVLNVTTMTRVRPNLLIGAAFQAASGVLYTRTFRQYCHDAPDEDGQCPAGGPTTYQEAPTAQRGKDFASLDLMLDWTKQGNGWAWGVYLQIKNVVGWDTNNTAAYKESFCVDGQFFGAGCAHPDQNIDTFEDGFPGPFPLIGFRLTF